MKTLTLLVVWSVGLAGVAVAQNKSGGGAVAGKGGALLGPYTIGAGAGQLPAAASCARCMAMVTDGATASDCVVGGGGATAVCYSNGTAWAAAGASYTLPAATNAVKGGVMLSTATSGVAVATDDARVTGAVGLSAASRLVASLPGGGANLLSTQVITNSAWTKTGAAVTGNIADSVGGMAAYRVTAAAGVGTHYTYYAGAIYQTAGSYTFSARVKAGSASKVTLTSQTNHGEIDGLFDLASNSGQTNNPTYSSVAILPDSGGYDRCVLTFDASSITFVLLGVDNGAGTFSYTAAGTEYVDVYQPTLTAPVTNLPAGTVALITDGVSAQDCSTGGGAYPVLCEWNGVSYTPLPSANGTLSAAAFRSSNSAGDSRLVFVGDSLTANGYPNSVTTAWPFTSRNLGSSGKTAASMLVDEPNNVCTLYAPNARWNIAVILAGINDLANTGATADQTFTSIRALHELARHCGFRTVAMTLTPAGTQSGPVQTALAAVNASIRATWSMFADGFVDVNAAANMADPTNTTYYQADQLHWSTGSAPSGNAYVGGLVGAEVDRLTGGVRGPIIAATAADDTKLGPSQCGFALTSNSNLQVRCKGSDGVVRAANLAVGP